MFGIIYQLVDDTDAVFLVREISSNLPALIFIISLHGSLHFCMDEVCSNTRAAVNSGIYN